MKLSEPKMITFLIAVGLALIGLIGQLAAPALAPYAFWLVFIGFLVLAIGNLVKGI